MIIEYVRYRIPEDAAESFLHAYRTAAASLDASPHCLGYELARCAEEPQRFVLRIRWTSAEAHLQGFRRSEEFRGFFAAVRPYVERIEEMQHYAATDVVSRPSIFDAVGGAGTFFRLAKRMHERLREDPTVGPPFSHAAATHVPHLGMWLCEVFGGPPLYSQTLGDIGPMLGRHAGRAITEAQRMAFVAAATRAVQEVIEPTQARARDAIVAYLEWGSRVAVENSRPDHVPDASAGVPRWHWPSEP